MKCYIPQAIRDHSCVKHFKIEHKRFYENYFATVTSEYKTLVLPENEKWVLFNRCKSVIFVAI